MHKRGYRGWKGGPLPQPGNARGGCRARGRQLRPRARELPALHLPGGLGVECKKHAELGRGQVLRVALDCIALLWQGASQRELAKKTTLESAGWATGAVHRPGLCAVYVLYGILARGAYHSRIPSHPWPMQCTSHRTCYITSDSSMLAHTDASPSHPDTQDVAMVPQKCCLCL